MFRRNPALLLSVLLLLLSCGRATVKDVRHVDLVIAGVSFDATTVTVLGTYASCATRMETIKVTASDDATRSCLLGLKEGQPVEFVERRMHFQLMTCGAKPTVMHSLGPCNIVRDSMSVAASGEACKS